MSSYQTAFKARSKAPSTPSNPDAQAPAQAPAPANTQAESTSIIPNDSSYAMRRGIRRKQLYPPSPAPVHTPTSEPAPSSSAPEPAPSAPSAPTDTGAQYYEKRASRIRRNQLTLDPVARVFVPRSLGLGVERVEGKLNAEGEAGSVHRLAELKFEQGANTKNDLSASMNQNTNTNANTSVHPNTNTSPKKKKKKRKKKRTKNVTECTPIPPQDGGRAQLSGDTTRGWIDGGGGGDGNDDDYGGGDGDGGGYTNENWAQNRAQNWAAPDDELYDSDDPIRAWMEPPQAAGVNERVLAWLDGQWS